MVEIIWKEPPPVVSSEKTAILGALKNNPGRWALVQERRSSTSATAPWKKLGVPPEGLHPASLRR